MPSLALITPQNVQVRTPNEPLRVVGIDLGTTNSAIAEIVIHPGDTNLPEVRCLEVEQHTRQGEYIHTLVPSVVAFADGPYGQLLVGEGAKMLRARLSEYGLEQNRNIFWDCKNDIGVRRTYHKAKDGFQSAKAIGGHVLRFLMDAALTDDPTPVTNTVVTTPASFQAAQRQDTVEAAALGGIDLVEGGLLDEPIAAFLDFQIAQGKQVFAEVSAPQRLVVFDFGGGTCDVALFQLLPPKAGQPVGIAPLTVSRYHRLGGSDIDRAIVVEVLLPQLMEQNRPNFRDLDYGEKSQFVIPALLGVAESLKIGLCQEIARLKKFDRYGDEERAALVKRNPGVYPCLLSDGTEFRLQSPTLSACQFDAVLKPFLDRDLLYAREADYHETCSVFAPLQDALDRAGLDRKDVDLCLAVGGSSLIPQIADAVAGFFSEARFLRFDNPERTQTAIAQGAAWQALSLAVYGRGIVQPVTSDGISIQTSDGPVRLVESGAKLPYPTDEGWVENNSLKVPRSGLTDDVELRVELRDSRGNDVMRTLWTIQPIVSRGDPLRLLCRMDSNQVLHLRLGLAHQPDREEFQAEVENPLTNVLNPNAKRNEILELEERMRTEHMSTTDQRATVKKIAELEADLGRREKALHLLSALNRPHPNAEILNRMGIICGEMADFARQEKLYREVARVSPHWKGPLFNLALSQMRQGKLEEAILTIDEALAVESDPPTLVLKATLAEKLERHEKQRDSLLDQAFAEFRPLKNLSDWELVWYLKGANLAGNSNLSRKVEDERQRREKSREGTTGVLPERRNEIERRGQ